MTQYTADNSLRKACYRNKFAVSADGALQFGNKVEGDVTVAGGATSALLMGAGNSTTPVETGTANQNFLGWWVKSTATSGATRAQYTRLYINGSGGSGDCQRIFTTLNTNSPSMTGAISGSHTTLSFGSSAGNLTGTIGVVSRNTLQVPNRQLVGNAAAVLAELYAEGTSSNGYGPSGTQDQSFFRASLSGNATGVGKLEDTCNLFYLDGFTAAASNIYAGNTLRINIGGTNKYLPVSNSEDCLDFSSGTPSTHPINLESVTLASNTNAIRGASVNPTRTSGWISFSGTVSATPTQVYTDYRNLTTTGVAEVLGMGSFPMMATGASCASMFGLQSICQVDSGATVLTASAAQGVGIYPIVAKTLIDSATVNSGAQIAAAWLSVQANVTDISGRASAILHMEVASGALRDIIYINATGGAMSTNFLNFSASASPVLSWGADNQPNAAAADLGLRCKVGASEYWIPMYVNT